MLVPAFLVHINGTFGAVINVDPGFFATDRAFHFSLPPPSFLFNSSRLTPLSLSSLQSVT
jgi:hypothetical protein